MRGEVLHYDDDLGHGFIGGDDGNRYTFDRRDLRQEGRLSKGTRVEFVSEDLFARQIVFAGSPVRTDRPVRFGRLAEGADEQPLGLFGYFRRCMTSRYADFRNRSRRKEFWGFVLFVYIGLAVIGASGLAIDAATGGLDREEPFAMMGFLGVGWLAVILPSVAVMVRRQHDIGLSGWFYLLILLPYVGGLILLVFALIPSQKHENKWGPVPAGVG